jgi:hypothetical protein
MLEQLDVDIPTIDADTPIEGDIVILSRFRLPLLFQGDLPWPAEKARTPPFVLGRRSGPFICQERMPRAQHAHTLNPGTSMLEQRALTSPLSTPIL